MKLNLSIRLAVLLNPLIVLSLVAAPLRIVLR